MTTHHGAAGSTYVNVEAAGEAILREHCSEFPRNDTSHIIPLISPNTHPEIVDPATGKMERHPRPMTSKDEKKIEGIESNVGGNQAENTVHNFFSRLLCKKQDVPILVLNAFKYHSSKFTAIRKDYPAAHKLFCSPQANMKKQREHDVIVLAKGLGVVAVEIKRTSDSGMMNKATHQLHSIQAFSDILLNAVSPPAPSTTSKQLPFVKIVMVPTDSINHSRKLSQDTFHFCGDAFDGDAFEKKWCEAIEELRRQAAIQPVTTQEFSKLTNLFAGLYFMETVTRFNDEGASLAHQTKSADELIDGAQLSSDAVVKSKKPKLEQEMMDPVNAVARNPVSSVFRNTSITNLYYLTLEQKFIFDNIIHCIVRGLAGTGKSLLIIFKILELIRDGKLDKILVVAPYPHNLRIRKILLENSVTVQDCKVFPVILLPSQVLVMEIQDFFRVQFRQLHSYNIHRYHLFIDDAHSAEVNFPEIYDFLVTHLQSPLYRWVMLDETQQWCYDVTNTTKPFRLLYTENEEIKTLLPIHTLQNVLRNSKEISEVAMAMRKDYIDVVNIPAHMSVRTHKGHNISGGNVEWHHLTNCGQRGAVSELFLMQRVEQVLRTLFPSPSPSSTTALQLHDVAIICDYYGSFFGIPALDEIKQMLLKKLNMASGTVEEQITSSSPMVVVDDVYNINSAEFCIVVYIIGSAGAGASANASSASTQQYYTIMSRARSRLIVIHSDYFSRDQEIIDKVKNINLTKWNEQLGKIVQL